MYLLKRKEVIEMFKKIIIMVLMLAAVASCQNYAFRALAWEYDFTPYPDSTIHIIVYHKAQTDTGFYAYDTTGASAVEWNLLDHRPFYNFTWRQFYLTAIQYNGPDFKSPVDSLFSFESRPSDTIRAYFKALPPGAINPGELILEKINIKDLPQL